MTDSLKTERKRKRTKQGIWVAIKKPGIELLREMLKAERSRIIRIVDSPKVQNFDVLEVTNDEADGEIIQRIVDRAKKVLI